MSSSPAAPLHLELAAAIRKPLVVTTWPLATWEVQVRLSRRLRLLSRLAAAIEGQGLLGSVPLQPRRHLMSALQLSRWRTGSMRWAVDRVGASLSGRGYPLVLLKGAAYLSQDLAIACGRLPSDLDVMVPKDALVDAQDRLRLDGWQEAELDTHDQRYYREWSHEAPPMRHPAHRMELDLHHNILPPIGKPRVDAALLIQRLQPSPWAGWSVLSPADQFLHAAAHLFRDSVLRDRLRDLVDLDGLARGYVGDESFWADVADRAHELGLEEDLTLAWHFLERLFGVSMPEAIRQSACGADAVGLRRNILVSLLSNAFNPLAPDLEPSVREKLVDALLLARYHLNRLPLRLLIPHLAHKWVAARRGDRP